MVLPIFGREQEMKKYGLQLRLPPNQQKQTTSKPPLRPVASIFGNDDDEDDVSKEISRQAAKSRVLQMIDEQQKKALEEDPSAFDYDGVYDEMKAASAHSRVQDQSKREKREREHEIIYERKLLKERNKDDHLYVDKEKFVTSAYKKKLAEHEKWIEEEKLRELREEKDDVTKRSDLTDFYFSLNKNVAFGGHSAKISDPSERQSVNTGEEPEGSKSKAESSMQSMRDDRKEVHEHDLGSHNSRDVIGHASPKPHPAFNIPQEKSKSTFSTSDKHDNVKALSDQVYEDEKKADEASGNSKIDGERFKRSEDALAAARERFLARKRAREQG
ncbi:hypothetical protein AXF42_Ash014267 [Apostasia shenzhenica]|uniref:Nuclear speckle splicing regulatory protein 1 N-terminal domain-containing protein n=1 Tax=Apostasia shenzhenica TaxID=1088818 RepID=A0A2I0A1E6_9ASPA|nr:hypothetical protein AXF42_Ash014267 [Apostasia shenzhenica]